MQFCFILFCFAFLCSDLSFSSFRHFPSIFYFFVPIAVTSYKRCPTISAGYNSVLGVIGQPAKSHGLPGNMGQNSFYEGHNFYVGCLGQNFLWVNFFFT